MELKLNNFSNKQDYYEQIGQTLNNWAQSFIRPIDYSVEHTTQAFASATSSRAYKIAVASMHTLVLPCTLTLYAMGTAVDQIGDFLKTRTYNYLPGKAQEKTPTPRTPFSLLSANLCMLPYGIATWAGMSPAQQRIDALAQKILQTNADFICLQEMAPDHANALWNKIHKHYAHGFSRIGPMPSNRMNGGLFFASKYPVEKTLYHPLPNTGPIARGIFCVKTHIGWILTGHLKAGDDDSDVILRKEQVSSIQNLCEKLSDNGTIPCLLAMDSNIKRTGKKNDEYELSGIPKYFYNSYTSSEPFSLTPENATCTNVPGLALQGKQPQTLEDAYEHIDYILSYKSTAHLLSIKTQQIPTYSIPNISPLSDHKILLAEGSCIPLANR
jgi:endonuclease/exonuclease/phosphatase family metal-dependent hydrolase